MPLDGDRVTGRVQMRDGHRAGLHRTIRNPQRLQHRRQHRTMAAHRHRHPDSAVWASRRFISLPTPDGFSFACSSDRLPQPLMSSRFAFAYGVSVATHRVELDEASSRTPYALSNGMSCALWRRPRLLSWRSWSLPVQCLRSIALPCRTISNGVVAGSPSACSTSSFSSA